MEESKNGDRCAFPEYGSDLISDAGLTKREYIATAAMQGLVAAGWTLPNILSGMAVKIADTLLAELDK